MNKPSKCACISREYEKQDNWNATLLCTYKELDLSPCSCSGERLSSIATCTDFVLNGLDWKSSCRPEGNNTAWVKKDFIFLKKRQCMHLAIMKSGTPENNLLEVLRCRESACWTHLSQDLGSWRKNISANWVFVNPRMPMVSLLAFPKIKCSFTKQNSSGFARDLGPSTLRQTGGHATSRPMHRKRWKIITAKEIYLEISSIIVQLTLTDKYSLERKLLAPMQCDLKTTVKFSE